MRIRAREEEAHVLGHRRTLAEEVREHGRPALAGVDALRDLRELHGIAEQDERLRARAERERVGERGLPRLVDEQVVERPVELLAREEPGGAREEVVVGVGEVAGCPRRSRRAPRPRSGTRRSPRDAFFSPRSGTPVASASSSISARSLWIALWLCEAIATRLPREIRCVMSRAPVHVFPEPGGPWTKRYEPSTSSISRPIASSPSHWTRRPPSGGSRRRSFSRCG